MIEPISGTNPNIVKWHRVSKHKMPPYDTLDIVFFDEGDLIIKKSVENRYGAFYNSYDYFICFEDEVIYYERLKRDHIKHG